MFFFDKATPINSFKKINYLPYSSFYVIRLVSYLKYLLGMIYLRVLRQYQIMSECFLEILFQA